MKVIHLLLTGEPGGIEVLAQTIGLHSEKENIMYFIFRGGTIAESMRDFGIPVVIANTPRFKWKEKIGEFVRYCSEEKVDVVVNHMYSPVACFYVYALKRKLPHIKILSYWHCDERMIVKGLKGKLLYRPLVRAMQRCCDKVIAISEFVKRAGIEAYGLREDKVAVIYNSIDLKRFAVSGPRPVNDTMELIFVGRLAPEKGVYLLLEALAKLSGRLNVHASIVGFGVEYENLVNQMKQLDLSGSVDFLGKRTDIPQLLAQADFFVHPAVCQEGFGITLIEAMACGKPCIASRGGAIPEIIDENTGFVFELGSASDLATKIEEAYQVWSAGRYGEMSEAARRKAEQYDIGTMVSKLEALY